MNLCELNIILFLSEMIVACIRRTLYIFIFVFILFSIIAGYKNDYDCISKLNNTTYSNLIDLMFNNLQSPIPLCC